ncbi:entericidin [Kozakia baliensis]|uniref:Entericidin n=2 Tax=Kozakia baliensis TaxID=153496 RepID=A0A1D8UW27_9PROT|nr:hypothetical protein [Kozakia baliensis]AOX17831.1 hypothetical protein A0U89_12540 [Kozakia baliensis]
MSSRRKSQSLRRAVQTVALLTALSGGLVACNTVSGAGKDVSSIGHDVTHGANATQDHWHRAQPSAATQ